jgi:hypothetical protein
MNSVRAMLAFCLCLSSAAASGLPIAFDFTIPGADGSVNGTPFVGQNVLALLQADTTQVTAATVGGSPGNCVAASGGSVRIGPAPPVALAAPLFVCAASDSSVIYLGPTNNAPAPAATFVAGGFTSRPYGLTSSYPFSVNLPGEIGGGASLNTASGTVFLSTFPGVGFAAVVSSTNVTGVTTLDTAALVGLSLLLALASIIALRRRAG